MMECGGDAMQFFRTSAAAAGGTAQLRGRKKVPFSSTFSAAAGATELLRGWKVPQKLALLALSDVGERGIVSRGHALTVGPSNCDYSL
jgi:hypothetical protein